MAALLTNDKLAGMREDIHLPLNLPLLAVPAMLPGGYVEVQVEDGGLPIRFLGNVPAKWPSWPGYFGHDPIGSLSSFDAR